MDAETLIWIIVPGLATGVGGLALLAVRRPSEQALDALLGFTAGVMLAATAFSLLVPALDRGSVPEVIAGFAAGAATIAALDALVPHAHARFRERGRAAAEERAERQATLLLSALTIHNLPEGLAVGVAFAAGGTELGIPIALAIGIQNVPEGFAAAAPLLRTGIGIGAAMGVAALTGVVEPPMAALAFASLELFSAILPLGLAFAAGAMLYVIVDELIPESHSHGNERSASVALLVGFALMLALDNAFG
ncbi:MAG: ZIP family metal transporter [Solirubrobacterales bacterium]|nr:ZIP family metal transporter [Solirubrobacterales bacterium]